MAEVKDWLSLPLITTAQPSNSGKYADAQNMQ